MKMMKKLVLVLVAGFILVSCGNEEINGVEIEKNEKVISSYANGTPQIVRAFDETDGMKIAVYEKEYYEDGNLLKEGPMVNERRNGFWKTYYRDGTLWSEGTFDKGMRNDSIKSYYPNGNIKFKGVFENGRQTGLWLFYDEDGKLTENKMYMQPGEVRDDSVYRVQ